MGVTMDLNNVQLLSDFAETHGLDYPKLRRLARKNKFTPPFKFGSDWMIDADTIPPVIPERKSRTRDDGRSRFVVYVDRATDECERIAAIVGVDNVIDLRDVRAARKLAATIADAEYVKMQRVIAADAGIDVV